MIKLIIKDTGKEVRVDYKQKNTNTLEHLSGICSLYSTIKKCTDMTDEDIIKFVKCYTKGDM